MGDHRHNPRAAAAAFERGRREPHVPAEIVAIQNANVEVQQWVGFKGLIERYGEELADAASFLEEGELKEKRERQQKLLGDACKRVIAKIETLLILADPARVIQPVNLDIPRIN